MEMRASVASNIEKFHSESPDAPMIRGVDETFEKAIRLEASTSVPNYCKALQSSARTGGDVAIAAFVKINPDIRVVVCVKDHPSRNLYGKEHNFRPISSFPPQGEAAAASHTAYVLWTEGGVGHYDRLALASNFIQPKRGRGRRTPPTPPPNPHAGNIVVVDADDDNDGDVPTNNTGPGSKAPADDDSDYDSDDSLQRILRQPESRSIAGGGSGSGGVGGGGGGGGGEGGGSGGAAGAGAAGGGGGGGSGGGGGGGGGGGAGAAGAAGGGGGGGDGGGGGGGGAAGGPSPADPLEEEARSLVGKRVLVDFAKGPYFGKVIEAIRPGDLVGAEDAHSWHLNVVFSDDEAQDYSLAEIREVLLRDGVSDDIARKENKSWNSDKDLYDRIRAGLSDKSFPTTQDDDGSFPAEENLIRALFRFKETTSITATRIAEGINKCKGRCHPDQTVGQTPKRRFLRRQILSALRFAGEAFVHRHRQGHEPQVDPPKLNEYPAFDSDEFAQQADLATASGGVPAQSNETHTESEDRFGLDAPEDADESVLNEDGSLPNTIESVDAFSLQDFALSPFSHHQFVPRKSMEKWARAYNNVASNLLREIYSPEPNRRKFIGRWARLYMGLPQLIFRNTGSGHNSKARANTVERRLDLFVNARFETLLQEWRRDVDRVGAKPRATSKPETLEGRTSQCCDLIGKGFITRGVQRLVGFGKADHSNSEIMEQMRQKHPQHEKTWDKPTLEAEFAPDLSNVPKVVNGLNPLVGVGPRGFKAHYLIALHRGNFSNAGAAAALGSFTDLGLAYVTGQMPAWLRRCLGGGLLSPLCKEEPTPGQTVDARPTKAEDCDTSVWSAALQKELCSAVRDKVTPEQLGVGVSGGCEAHALCPKLEISEATRNGKLIASATIDIANAHNEFARDFAIDEMNAQAKADPRLGPLPVAFDAITHAAPGVFMRSNTDPSGFTKLCDSKAGGGQGNALTNLAFPSTIDGSLKRTSAKFPDVRVKAIQDDVNVCGDPPQVWEAVDFLVEDLRKAGLKANLKKCKCFVSSPEALANKPAWLQRTWEARDSEVRQKIDVGTAAVSSSKKDIKTAEAAGDSIQQASAAENFAKAELDLAALRASVPEDGKAFGYVLCGSALGDAAFEDIFLESAQLRLCGTIDAASAEAAAEAAESKPLNAEALIDRITKLLAATDSQTAYCVLHYSLQNRVDYLLATHLPSKTRKLAAAVDEALRRAYTLCFGGDFLDPAGEGGHQTDPAFVSDLFRLKLAKGGVGLRRTVDRAPYLNTIHNLAPQLIGRSEEEGGLWPSLASVFGAKSFHEGNEANRWKHFYSTGCPYAKELRSEWLRLQGLHQTALSAAQNADTSQSPDPILSASPEGFGANVPSKLHKKVFDTLAQAHADAIDRRAKLLPRDDQRRMVRLAAGGSKFANSLLLGTPLSQVKFTSQEFETAAQIKLGVPVTALAPLVGNPITNNANSPPARVDRYGNNLKKVTGVKHDGVRALHDSLVDVMSTTLERARISHKGGVRGHPNSCSDIFSDLLSWAHLPPTEQRRLQGIIPDMVVNGTSIRPTAKESKNRLHGAITLLDNKTLCNLKDYEGPNPEVAATKREQKVDRDYIAAAKQLDKRFHETPDGESGPVEQRLLQFGRAGKVHGTVFGTFGDVSPGVTDLCGLAGDALAHEHLQYFDGAIAQAKAMHSNQIRRVWAHTSMRGWAKLVLDRRCLAGGGHSSWTAPPTPVDEDPDETEALLDFHFTNPSARSDLA